MTERFKTELGKALTKNGVDFDILVILASVDDTLTEQEAADRLAEYNEQGSMYVVETVAQVKIDFQWAAGSVSCDLCGQEWVAVRRASETELECPNCSNTTTFTEVDHG